MRKKVIDTGELVVKGKTLIFTKKVLFKSPSGAAVSVLAKRANGWIEW